MSIRKIELKAVGQEAVLHIDSCKLASVGKYPEVEFMGTDVQGILALIVVNQKSTDRQLGRLSLTYQTVVGQRLRFSRSDSGDPSKPFWDINFADQNDAPAAAKQSAPTRPVAVMADAGPGLDAAPHPADRTALDTAAASSDPTPRDSADLYLSLTRDTLVTIIPLYVTAGIAIDMSAVAAIVNTRYINARRGY